jgi:hypothetical protein
MGRRNRSGKRKDNKKGERIKWKTGKGKAEGGKDRMEKWDRGEGKWEEGRGLEEGERRRGTG